MKCYVPPLALLTLFLTFFASAQDHSSSTEHNLLAMDFRESIIWNTENSGTHDTLSAAMKAAGLDNVLNFDGPFTVFAPSDKALETLFSDTVPDLFAPENKSVLQALLRYHIIAGEFTASRILKALCRGGGKATFMTVQGESLSATIEGIDIILTDSYGNSARITTADVNQCNGIIHEIDSVILPRNINFLP
ncbi:MAG: fasciclin domain-containing protein [Maribacter sp.]|uniref:fasciclin domain-containing protein n=1 Tax=Maribacter sp. TaxID=1897614 RepID=UPI003C77D12A